MFRNMCKRSHQNEICGPPADCKTKGCLKRHTTVCRNFTQNKSCKHNEKCAYQHSDKVNCTQQSDINELMIQIISKHDKDKRGLLEEIEKVKINVFNMGNQIKSPNDELQASLNDTDPDVEDNGVVVVHSVTAKETNSVEAEITNNNNHWLL